MSIRDMVFHL